jgi:folate-binding Fe-S cluster repair protein YgfZ
VSLDIDALRRSITEGARLLRITSHAQVEASKDGLLLADLRHVFETGVVIESYAEARALVYGRAMTEDLPVHVVVEEAPDEVVIVTVYIPSDSDWIGYTKRRKKS